MRQPVVLNLINFFWGNISALDEQARAFFPEGEEPSFLVRTEGAGLLGIGVHPGDQPLQALGIDIHAVVTFRIREPCQDVAPACGAGPLGGASLLVARQDVVPEAHDDPDMPTLAEPEPTPTPTLAEPAVTDFEVVVPRREEPPVIEVRIGRIEVQAAPPGPAATAPPPRPARVPRRPKLSLEDYLRRRREG